MGNECMAKVANVGMVLQEHASYYWGQPEYSY